MKIQAYLTAAAINLKRLGAALLVVLSGTWIAQIAAQGLLRAHRGNAARNKLEAVAAA